MKNILFIAFAVFGSSFLYSQTAIGVRIGNTSSGFQSNVTNTTNDRVSVESEGERMVGYVVYDENENVVSSRSISETNNTSVDVDNLSSGFYYIAVVSENDEVSVNGYVKP